MDWKRFFRPTERRPGELLFMAVCSFVILVALIFITVRETRRLLVSEDALQAHRGQVVDIFVDTRQVRSIKVPAKKKRYTLLIDHSVANGLERYRIGHNHRRRFDALREQMQIRDTVVLYTSAVNFDGKNPHTIRRIDKNGETIFSYAEAQRQIRFNVIAAVAATLVLFLLSWWNLKLYRKAKRRVALGE